MLVSHVDVKENSITVIHICSERGLILTESGLCKRGSLLPISNCDSGSVSEDKIDLDVHGQLKGKLSVANYPSGTLLYQPEEAIKRARTEKGSREHFDGESFLEWTRIAKLESNTRGVIAGAGGGAMVGAGFGSVAGPPGAIIGATVGAIIGGVSTAFVFHCIIQQESVTLL